MNKFKIIFTLTIIFFTLLFLTNLYAAAQSDELLTCGVKNITENISLALEEPSNFIEISSLKNVWGNYSLAEWEKIFEPITNYYLYRYINSMGASRNPNLEIGVLKINLDQIEYKEILKYKGQGLRYDSTTKTIFMTKQVKLKNDSSPKLKFLYNELKFSLNGLNCIKECYDNISGDSNHIYLKKAELSDLPKDLEYRHPEIFKTLSRKLNQIKIQNQLECLILNGKEEIIQNRSLLINTFQNNKSRNILLNVVPIKDLVRHLKYEQFMESITKATEYIKLFREKNVLEDYIEFIPPGYAVDLYVIDILSKDEALRCGSLKNIHKIAIDKKRPLVSMYTQKYVTSFDDMEREWKYFSGFVFPFYLPKFIFIDLIGMPSKAIADFINPNLIKNEEEYQNLYYERKDIYTKPTL